MSLRPLRLNDHSQKRRHIKWAVTNNKASKFFLLHGEPNSKIALRDKLYESGLTQVEIPERGSIYYV